MTGAVIKRMMASNSALFLNAGRPAGRVADHMRASLLILVFIFGCVGCQQTQLADRPSFYDNNNIAEYYGRCPKCQRWVKGYFSHIMYTDIGCASGVTGTCKYCRVGLFEEGLQSLTNRSRIVRWTEPR